VTQPRFQGHGVIIDTLDVLCVQLTRNLFAMAKFLSSLLRAAYALIFSTVLLVTGLLLSLLVVSSLSKSCKRSAFGVEIGPTFRGSHDHE